MASSKPSAQRTAGTETPAPQMGQDDSGSQQQQTARSEAVSTGKTATRFTDWASI